MLYTSTCVCLSMFMLTFMFVLVDCLLELKRICSCFTLLVHPSFICTVCVVSSLVFCLVLFYICLFTPVLSVRFVLFSLNFLPRAYIYVCLVLPHLFAYPNAGLDCQRNVSFYCVQWFELRGDCIYIGGIVYHRW